MTDETRHGVDFSHLDQPIFDGADATKRDLVDYLEAVSDRIIAVLRDRPLSVMRVRPGQPPFMQKNVPKYAPDWVHTITLWAESSKRDVSYALCNDLRTLLWFANQRAVEYHPSLVRVEQPDRLTHLIFDLDPPSVDAFAQAVQVAALVRRALDDVGLSGAVKTSGAKGLHIFVPVADVAPHDAAAATRCLARRAVDLGPDIATAEFIKEDRGDRVFVDPTRVGAGATVIAAYSPRIRPGVPVSFPVTWDDLAHIKPADFTIKTAIDQLGGRDPWAEHMPAPQQLPEGVVEEGHTIPIPRVQAMHEGKRRAARARKKSS